MRTQTLLREASGAKGVTAFFLSGRGSDWTGEAQKGQPSPQLAPARQSRVGWLREWGLRVLRPRGDTPGEEPPTRPCKDTSLLSRLMFSGRV